MAELTRQNLIDRIARRLGTVDSAKLTPDTTTKDELLAEALSIYDRSRPLRRVFELAGSNVTRRYQLDSAISGWINGSWRVDSVESVSDANTDNEIATPVQFLTTVTPAGKDVLILEASTGGQTTVRITYSRGHVVTSTASECSLPDQDVEPLTLLGVSVLASWTARTASDIADASLGAEQVDYSDIASRWSDRAREAMKSAQTMLSPTDSLAAGGGSAYDWGSWSELPSRLRGD